MDNGNDIPSLLTGFCILFIWVSVWILTVRLLRRKGRFNVLVRHAIGLSSGFFASVFLLLIIKIVYGLPDKADSTVALMYWILGITTAAFLYWYGNKQVLLSLKEDTAESKTAPPSGKPSAGVLELEPRLAEYWQEAHRLLEKGRKLPESLAASGLGIFLTTEKILSSMREDPADVEPGGKFLDRYLPAAHSIVDEYERLSKEGAGSHKVEEVLKKSEEMLRRLDEAFRAEHDSLLRNDTVNLLVQLEVLDRQLKMDGR